MISYLYVEYCCSKHQIWALVSQKRVCAGRRSRTRCHLADQYCLFPTLGGYRLLHGLSKLWIKQAWIIKMKYRYFLSHTLLPPKTLQNTDFRFYNNCMHIDNVREMTLARGRRLWIWNGNVLISHNNIKSTHFYVSSMVGKENRSNTRSMSGLRMVPIGDLSQGDRSLLLKNENTSKNITETIRDMAPL